MFELEADSISLAFGGREILRDVYLSCRTGETVGLLGRNGQGKSCLLQILFGVLDADYKLVRINKQPLKTACRRPDLIRCLPQFSFLPSEITLRQAFDAFGTDYRAFETFYPEQNWPVNARIGQLSGGQKRLLETYLVICSDTRFVLLDEPFTHLMPLQIERIKDLIRAEKQHKGFIVTDHLYQEIMEVSDRLYLLAGGKTHLVTDAAQLRDLGYLR